jgi:phosphoribosyl 1,2-cyclic phosphodiesterase
MHITFWGVRGSIASPGPLTAIFGGNTTCVEVVLDSGKTVVIDAGTGIRNLGDSLLERGKHQDLLLLLTHIHWDHILGFPFFAPLFTNNTHIRLDGVRRGIEGVKRILSSNYVDGTWPIRFEDLKARIEPTHTLTKRSIVLDDTEIFAHQLQHPQGGLGFKFVSPSGTFVFVTDNELLAENSWTGCSLKDFTTFCEGADLLVHDCQYMPEEVDSRRGWGHSDVNAVSTLAADAGVKRLVLFHHDPWRTDQGVASMTDLCRDVLHEKGAHIAVEAAREGKTLEIGE